jgi:hypothetical protein
MDMPQRQEGRRIPIGKSGKQIGPGDTGKNVS